MPSNHFFFSPCESSKWAAGRGFGQIFSFLGQRCDVSVCGLHSVNSREPLLVQTRRRAKSHRSSDDNLFWKRECSLFSAGRPRPPRLQTLPEQILRRDHARPSMFSPISDYSCVMLCYHAPPQHLEGISGTRVAIGFTHSTFVSVECGKLLTPFCLKKKIQAWIELRCLLRARLWWGGTPPPWWTKTNTHYDVIVHIIFPNNRVGKVAVSKPARPNLFPRSCA